MTLAPIDWSTQYHSWGVSTSSLERAYSPARLLDVLGAAFRSLGTGPILELGCAPGRWLAWIESHLTRPTVGLDLDASGIALSRELYPSLRLVRGDAQILPFADQVFAASFSLGLLEHFEDPLPILRETFRVVRPGGVLVCSVPNLEPGSFCHWHWRRSFPEHFTTHRIVRLTELADAVRAAGFDVIEQAYNGLYLPHLQRVLGRLPGRRWFSRLEHPRLATSLVVTARRAP